MKLLIIISILFLASCSKSPEAIQEAKQPFETGTIYPNVIYLDFDGQTILNDGWNNNQGFTVTNSGLTKSNEDNVLRQLSGIFDKFQVTVTNDEAIFNNTLQGHRMRVVITESYKWFKIPFLRCGTSIEGSFKLTDDTPCFVFSSLCSYDVNKISVTAAHELGHTLGLLHQSVYDNNCNKVNEYRGGAIMGEGFSNVGWVTGQSSTNCNTIQDDIKEISKILPIK